MHTQDVSLTDARALVARAIDKAAHVGVRGAVAIVGASGGISASGATVGPFVNIPGIDRRMLIAEGKPANSEEGGCARRPVAVAIVDHRGDPIQQDTMDGTPTAAPFVAEAVAAGAATFGLPSHEVEPAMTTVLPYRALPVPRGSPDTRRRSDRRRTRYRRATCARVSRDRGRGARVRICIVGCGAIGGLYAAHLAQLSEVDVWAYDISAEHVHAINRDRLRLAGRASLTARVNARRDASEIPPCELGIIAVKATATDAAMAATADVFADGAVCSVQNGIGSEEIVARHVTRVIRGVCLPAGHVTAPGVVNMDATGPTWIGPFEPQPASMAEVERLGDALNGAGLPTHALTDARGAQWTKLLFNASTNPIAALTGLTHGKLCNIARVRAAVTALVDEGRSVAEALGIALESDPDELISRAAVENHGHRPSMLQDALAHRPTEIEALNGGIVREGERAGVPTPLHATITALITGLEAGWQETR